MIEIRHRHTNGVLYVSKTRRSVKGALLDALASGSDLRGSDLSGSDLSGSDLSGSDLSWSDLRGSDLSGSDLSDILVTVPLIANLDAAILSAIEASQAAGKEGLHMATWHTCDMTHCRGGWAVTLAGDAGRKLEDEYGTAMAAALIYLKAGATQIPDWYASDERAMADLRARAGV